MERKEIIDLMLGKLNKELDIQWEDIAEKSGMNVSKDHIRKMAYGVRLYDDYLTSMSMMDTKNDVEEIKEKLVELKKKRQQLSDERTYTNKKIRALSRLEDFMELMKDELILLAEEKPLELRVEKPTKCSGGRTGVLLLSDIHYGINTNWGDTVYNSDVAKERMEKLCTKVLEYCNLHNVNKLVVLELGDTLSGHIHNNLRLENRECVVQQIIGVSELISTALYHLCEYIPKVEFHMVGGNHDRVLPKKDENLNKDSFVALTKELIYQRTKDIENLKVDNEANDGYKIVPIEKSLVYMSHGDKDNLSKVSQGVYAVTGQVPDYVVLGHYHNAKELTENKTEIIINGSFSSTDEYAVNIRKNSPAVQKFMIFDDGGRECTYNIRLDN